MQVLITKHDTTLPAYGRQDDEQVHLEPAPDVAQLDVAIAAGDPLQSLVGLLAGQGTLQEADLLRVEQTRRLLDETRDGHELDVAYVGPAPAKTARDDQAIAGRVELANDSARDALGIGEAVARAGAHPVTRAFSASSRFSAGVCGCRRVTL
jgi:hypothetical protein